ncbi:hypothetical protein KAZ57_03085 [Patescibacteria group bacterium]|jgi:hypothetical protein|nr:hypothetical protein [Patescibacteria group bacterium]
MSKNKQVEYNLQISIDSLLNERVLNIESAAPFNSITVGEKFYPVGDTSHWFSDGQTPNVLYVVDVAHAVYESQFFIMNQVFVALSSKAPNS